jgi:hypothetical protein
MSKKSLFKSLIPSLVAVSFAGWGSVALAADPIASGDVLGEGICGGNPGKLIAGFNFPGITGDLNTIVKLVSGQKPEAVEVDGNANPIPPYPWILNEIHDEIVIHSIELLAVVNDGAELIVDQTFDEPPENGDLPKTDIDPSSILQVYFCGDVLLVEMSDATVKLANGKATFSVDPVSEMKEKAASYKAVCVAESDSISADGRTNYDVDLNYDEVKCHIEEMGQNGKTFDHEAVVE